MAQRRGSSSTNLLKRRNPSTTTTARTPPSGEEDGLRVPAARMRGSDCSFLARRAAAGRTSEGPRVAARPLPVPRGSAPARLLVDVRLQPLVLERMLVLQVPTVMRPVSHTQFIGKIEGFRCTL